MTPSGGLGATLPPKGTARWSETRRRLDDCGVRLIEAEAALFLPDTTLDSQHDYLEAAAYLGAMGVTPSFFGDWEAARIADTLAAFVLLAADYGLRTLIEFMPLSAIRTIDEGLRYARMFGANDVGIAVDTLHLARSGGTAADVARIVATAPGVIATAQLNDAPFPLPFDGRNWWDEMSNGRRFFGEGNLPVREVVAALPPGIPLGIEVCSRDFRASDMPPVDKARHARAAFTRCFGLDVAG